MDEDSPDIFDAIKDYAAASNKLESLIRFIRDEIVKINETGDSEIDHETRQLNDKIKRRAESVFCIAENIFTARKEKLGDMLSSLAYALGPDDDAKILTEDEIDEIGEDVDFLAKVSVVHLLGIDFANIGDDSGDDGDDEESTEN